MADTHYTPLAPVSCQSITATSAGAAVGFTISAASAASATKPEANYMMFTVETTDCRFRDDGTDPTTTTGVLVPKSILNRYDGNVRNIKFISTGAQAIIWGALYRSGP